MNNDNQFMNKGIDKPDETKTVWHKETNTIASSTEKFDVFDNCPDDRINYFGL